MSSYNADGRRRGEPRPEFESLVDGVGIVPARRDVRAAWDEIVEHGAVIVPSPTARPDALVEVAATVLGARLRRVFPLRPQHEVSGPLLGLHCDGAYVNADVHGQVVKLRDPDEDYVLQRVDAPPTDGGDSFVVDGYRMLERIGEKLPELHSFLTGTDIDYFGLWDRPSRGVPATPLLRRLAEFTRAGRRVVRASDYAAPAPRTPTSDLDTRMLEQYADVVATAGAVAPRFALAPDEVLMLDNYRFLHGRDPFEGPRTVHVLTVLSSDSWACW